MTHREALRELVEALRELRDAVKQVPEMNNRKYDALGIRVNRALAKAESLLAAPERVDGPGGKCTTCGHEWGKPVRLAAPEGECAGHAAEIEETLATYELITNAIERGQKLWQAAHPEKPLTWPDTAALVEWLIERFGATETEERIDGWLHTDYQPKKEVMPNHAEGGRSPTELRRDIDQAAAGLASPSSEGAGESSRDTPPPLSPPAPEGEPWAWAIARNDRDEADMLFSDSIGLQRLVKDGERIVPLYPRSAAFAALDRKETTSG